MARPRPVSATEFPNEGRYSYDGGLEALLTSEEIGRLLNEGTAAGPYPSKADHPVARRRLIV